MTVHEARRSDPSARPSPLVDGSVDAGPGPVTFAYSDALPPNVEADLLVLPTFRGASAGPGTPDLSLVEAYAMANLSGDVGEDLLIVRRAGDSFHARAVLLVGMGERRKADLDLLRRTAVRAASQSRRFATVATTLPQALEGGEPEEGIRATIEGFSAGAYRFNGYATRDGRSATRAVENVCLLGRPEWMEPEIRGVIDRTATVERAAAWARDLVNIPAGDLTPEALASQAQEMASACGLAVRIWDESELRAGGFGGILGVGAGSQHPPRLIELRYEPPDAARGRLLGLTGKGVTFDSGGLSLKKQKDMLGMKSDMAGAAAVLATMRAVAELAPPDIGVLAAIPTAENMPGGSAIRPGDVLRHRNGLTTEVVDPDAEGRLLLADALAYLVELQPTAIVDVATLTYSCIAALGEEITAGLGNDRALLRSVVAASEAVGEPIWELPLWRRYRSQLGSEVANLRNEGKEDVAGAIVAALFLEEFVAGTPWVHLDIGGTAYLDESTDGLSAGGTGVPTRTLVRLVTKIAGMSMDAEELRET